jgi:hypothetical protein
MMMKSASTIMLLLFAAVGLRADQGTTANSFLKLETGPRAIAMAESFAGLADDVNAIQYNPAGLAYLTDKEVTLMHAQWVQDIFYDHLAVDWPIDKIGTLGFSAVYLNAGNFDRSTLDSLGNPVVNGTFTANSYWAGLSYARTIVPFIAAGLNIKLISETIDTSSASSVAVDLAAMYHSPVPGLNAGINIQNLGPSSGFHQTFNQPINFRAGVGYKPSKTIAVDADYTQPIETVGTFSVGGEYGYRDFLFLRLGYKYGGAVDYNQTFTGFGPAVAAGLSMGVGFVFYKNYSLDYAYENYGFLGAPQRFAITAKF